MLFQRINRTDPEKVFVIAKNSYSTASLTNGQAVIWDMITDHDGIAVTVASASASMLNLASFAGIVAQTIAHGEYGLIQVYGYHSAVRARMATTASDGVEAGMGLTLAVAGSVFCLESVHDTGINAGHSVATAYVASAYTLWTTTTVEAFIKAM